MGEWPLRYEVANCGTQQFGDSIKIKALKRQPGNPGWTVIPVRRKLLFLGDLDDIQFQTIMQDIADNIVVLLGITNNREGSED